MNTLASLGLRWYMEMFYFVFTRARTTCFLFIRYAPLISEEDYTASSIVQFFVMFLD